MDGYHRNNEQRNSEPKGCMLIDSKSMKMKNKQIQSLKIQVTMVSTSGEKVLIRKKHSDSTRELKMLYILIWCVCTHTCFYVCVDVCPCVPLCCLCVYICICVCI